MDSNKNCGKSSAKSLKGFTLIEMLVVIAILAILAGISSIVISGFVRDARLETARDKAQTVYTAVQNALVQMEIKQESEIIDPTTYGAGGTFSKYVTLSFVMDNGAITSSHDFVIDDGTTIVTLTYDYPNSTPATTSAEKKFRKLAKYLTDNLAMDFTGYVYAAIDMEDWMADTVVCVDDYEKVENAANGITDFIPSFKTKSSLAAASNGRVPFCEDIFDQKSIYMGKKPSKGSYLPEAAGMAVGYYPLYSDIGSSTTVSYT